MAEIYLNYPIDEQLMKDAMITRTEKTGFAIEGQEGEQQSSDIIVNLQLLEIAVLRAINYLSQGKVSSEVKQRALSIFNKFDDYEENIMQILFKHNKDSIYWLFQLKNCDFNAAKKNIERASVSSNLLPQIVAYSFNYLLDNTVPTYKRPQSVHNYTRYCLLLDELGFTEFTDDFAHVSKLIKRQTDGDLISQRKAIHAIRRSADFCKRQR